MRDLIDHTQKEENCSFYSYALNLNFQNEWRRAVQDKAGKLDYNVTLFLTLIPMPGSKI